MVHLSFKRQLWMNIRPFFTILTLGLFLWALGQSQFFDNQPNILSLGITVDFALVIPLVYWWLIRKTTIPTITVVPVFVWGVWIAGWILPQDYQTYPALMKMWALPVVELGILGLIVWKVRGLMAGFQQAKGQARIDFHAALKTASAQVLPARIAHFFAGEVSAIAYAFFIWKKPKPVSGTQFTYHQKSGTPMLLAVLILLIAVETFAFHIMLERWSVLAAWILSGLSIYSGVTFLGFSRAMKRRFHEISSDMLYLNYGIMSEASIPLKQIKQVQLASPSPEYNEEHRSLSPLGTIDRVNITVVLKEPLTFQILYGFKQNCQSLSFFIDEKSQFLASLEAKGIAIGR